MAELFLHPNQELTLAEVTRRTGLAQAVVHKEVSRLVNGGVLTDRREGNNRLVRVAVNHPLFRPMAQIIAAAYGPVPVLRDLLGPIDTVAEAFIYGSWAARRSGEVGLPPRDIDVMVVGDLSVDDMIDVQEAARSHLGLEVNVHRTTPAAWAARDCDPFLSQVASQPVVPLVGKEPSDA